MEKPYRKFTDLLDEFLEDPQFAADFLTEALTEENLGVFLLSLKDVMRVHGSLTALADKAKISRSTLYNLFSKKANPEMKTVLAVLDYLGYCLKVSKKEPLPSKRTRRTSIRRRKSRVIKH